MREFPSEGEWLELEAPAVSGDFVERALRAVLADRGHDYVEEDPDAVPALPTAALQSYAVPATSDFVARTLQRLEVEQAARLRALMLRYVAPEPSPDFVARTLRALREEPKPVVHLLQLRRALALAAAAALLLWLFPWPHRAAGTVQQVEVAAGRTLPASTWTASPWPIERRSAQQARDPRALPLAAADGLLLLSRREGVR